ncbi:MAG: DUF3141 domain-containing protein, partial [Rhizobacter sp.]|nr:DUF3141 domain-containing protein [Rhizobacter sp.]
WHPKADGKPVLIGNCQAGWQIMMMSAIRPDVAGPILLAGSPLSYWAGIRGQSPMRYLGGLLGGTWLSSLTSDLGNGKFDGAWLVQNFENLNPANAFWDKYVNVFANIDTEPQRFLEFERWWGGYFLMNREEIEWITQNLFVGNKLWTGGVQSSRGHTFDLREIKVPIVLFASLGDNITPPQQAFNWVADVYESTEEIKARGQVIVGLMHEEIGHLGIFVAGKVAKKEHAQIVSVLRSIEALPPGLYGMKIAENASDGGSTYEVSFLELRLEEVVKRLNRFEREDERPFAAMNAVSEFNQRAYELFGRPVAQAVANEYTAKLARKFHPLRFQRWAFSDLNPALWWLASAAQAVQANRQAVAADAPGRQLEAAFAEVVSATLDFQKSVRDALGEASFFEIYGNLSAFYFGDKRNDAAAKAAASPRELSFVKDALAAIDKGGYAEALARVAVLMAHEDGPLPLSRVELAQELLDDYRKFLPDLPRDQVRRIGGVQEIVAEYEPEKAIAALPALLADREDRERLLTLLDRVLADPRVQRIEHTPQQRKRLEQIRRVLRPAARIANGRGRASASGRKLVAVGGK